MGKKLVLVVLLITTLVILSGCVTTRGTRRGYRSGSGTTRGYRAPRYTTCAWCGRRCYDTEDMGRGEMTEAAYLGQLRTGAIWDGKHVFCSLRCKNLASRNIEVEKYRSLSEEEQTWRYED